MADNPNTLDYVRRIENFEQRLEHVLGLDDSEFDDLDVFRREEDEFLDSPNGKCYFRFSDSDDEYAAIVVGSEVPHFETDSENFIAGYNGKVFQLCKGMGTTDPFTIQNYVVGIIVAQSVGEPLEIGDLLQPGKLEKEVMYIKKVFKKMGLSHLSANVSIYLDSCYF